MGAVALAGLLYLADLTGMGMVSKDEPRYADIGRAMAQSGDWITPRLWGEPWFEKPALLYWLIGAGFRLHLGDDLAPRLPIALLSLAFLAFFWWRLRLIWDTRVASHSTVILATTVGWLAYSHVAVTDLPLSVFFTMAVLFSLPPDRARNRTFAAAALALATLAKSLVPIVLFLPVLALDFRRLRDWLRPGPLLAFAAIALPWPVLCTLRNGSQFPRVLFLQQQLGRFFSPELQHERSAWYYFPVLLLFLYPWFPLLAIVPRDLRDRRTLTLISVVVFGFAFFSLSVNKLPGYVLPLLPAACILMGTGLARSTRMQRAVALPVALLGALPIAARVVAQALAGGLRTAAIPIAVLGIWLPVSMLAAVVIFTGPCRRAFAFAALLTGLAFLWFQIAAFPAIDAAASARPSWLASHPTCSEGGDRGLIYGLYYYSGHVLLPCTSTKIAK
jgi:4-amino-4-deoxy-L-arabinose transferase-like glycosyltransferase